MSRRPGARSGAERLGRRGFLRAAVSWPGLVAALSLVGAGAGLVGSWSSSPAAAVGTAHRPPSAIPEPRPSPSPLLSGPLRAPGGPYLYDSRGRVVFLHGVNAVYKHPPFEVYPDPGRPWNLGPADASRMAALGFDVVRLGMTWEGLEPGHVGPNDPAICSPGRPGDPHQYDAAVAARYLRRLRQTVDLLGRYHIYSVLDMHQDVYNQVFDGEGAPPWAVCTDGLPASDPPGRWSLAYTTRAAGIAFNHFWSNDVRGNLQGEYDRIWGVVARWFRDDPWVLGYDVFNEPYSTSLILASHERYDAQLECFYAGPSAAGSLLSGRWPTRCPPHDPASGVIPSILANDPWHLVFFEPDNYGTEQSPTVLAPMNFPNLVYEVHVYCPSRSPVTGNPTDLPACAAEEARSLVRRAVQRPGLSSIAQPDGPPWIVGEFGASSNAALLSRFTELANDHLVGWIYWAWKYYADPTGSADEAMVTPTGQPRPPAAALSQTYAQAVAGTPERMSFDPSDGSFHLAYLAARRSTAPTLIFVPARLGGRRGYCTRADGAQVVSPAGSRHLLLANLRRARRVVVDVSAGWCPRPAKDDARS